MGKAWLLPKAMSAVFWLFRLGAIPVVFLLLSLMAE